MSARVTLPFSSAVALARMASFTRRTVPMGMAKLRSLPVTPLVQMQEEEEPRPEEEDEEELQAKSVGAPALAPAVARAAAAVSGGGRPLSRSERAWVEPRLGRDLSPVRVHDDATAGAAARGINARAFTLRNHIAFAPGTYDPGSADGRDSIAPGAGRCGRPTAKYDFR